MLFVSSAAPSRVQTYPATEPGEHQLHGCVCNTGTNRLSSIRKGPRRGLNVEYGLYADENTEEWHTKLIVDPGYLVGDEKTEP